MLSPDRIDAAETANFGVRLDLAVDFVLPDALTEGSKLLICLPGGGASRGYFDLPLAGDQSFSFARAMAAAGHVVVLVDPPGVGENRKVDEPYEYTAEKQMPLLASTVEQLRASRPGGMDLSGLPVIGVGHSAGGMLTALLQDHAQCFEALGMFSFGTVGLPQHLDADYIELAENDILEARQRISEYTRKRFPTGYFKSPLRSDAGPKRAALESINIPTISTVGMLAMTPGNIAPELARIAVPVFTAAGEFDMVGPHHELGRAYTACPDFTRVTVQGAGHSIFLADAAPALYTRFAGWLDTLTIGQGHE